jgi:hypothetical protein
MKKVMAGGILLFCGVILFLGIYIPAAFHAAKLSGWSTPPGRLGTALHEMGGAAAMNYSVIIIVAGIILIVWGCFGAEAIRRIKKFKQRKPEEL